MQNPVSRIFQFFHFLKKNIEGKQLKNMLDVSVNPYHYWILISIRIGNIVSFAEKAGKKHLEMVLEFAINSCGFWILIFVRTFHFFRFFQNFQKKSMEIMLNLDINPCGYWHLAIFQKLENLEKGGNLLEKCGNDLEKLRKKRIAYRAYYTKIFF